MSKDIVRQVVNGLAVIGTITMNGLANALPLNGQLTGEISDRFRVFFVPAGYVFSIWGLIYVGLLAFCRLPGPSLPTSECRPAPHRLPTKPERCGQRRLALLVALQPVRLDAGGDGASPGEPPGDLPAPRHREDAGDWRG